MLSSVEMAAALSGQAPRSMGSKAVRGVMWNTVQTLAIRLSGFLVFLVLARLLAPAEFGLLAAAQVIVALARTLAEAGLTRTLIQREHLRAAHLDSALLVVGGIGGVLSLALVVAAPAVSDIYDLPNLRPVLTVLAVIPFLTALSSVPESILRRQMRFRSVAMRGISSVVVSGVVGVALAVAGAGVWALVAQAVSLAAIGLVVRWVYVGWMPSRCWEWVAVRELMSFGTHVLGISLFSFLNRRTGEFVIGIVLGPIALGLYSVATKILSMAIDILVSNVRAVALPVFSRMAEQPERLAQAYLGATGVTTFLAAPGFTLLGAFGEQLTPLVFGQQWLQAGQIMSILAFIGPVQSIGQFNNSMMLATGHSLRALQWTGCTAMLNVLGFVVSAQFGILVVAAVYVATAWVLLPVGMYLVRTVSTVRFSDQMRTLGVPLAGCAAMLLVVAALHLIPGITSTLLLLIGVPAATVVYLLVVLPFRRDMMSTMLNQLLRRRTPAADEKRAEGSR